MNTEDMKVFENSIKKLTPDKFNIKMLLDEKCHYFFLINSKFLPLFITSPLSLLTTQICLFNIFVVNTIYTYAQFIFIQGDLQNRFYPKLEIRCLSVCLYICINCF